jgi:hypothetical protein
VSLDASIGLARADDKLAKGDQDSFSYVLNGEWGQRATSVTAGPNGTSDGSTGRGAALAPDSLLTGTRIVKPLRRITNAYPGR